MNLVDKYRPSTLDEIIGHDDIIKSLKRFVKRGEIPHLLFYGTPGTGKTTAARAIAKELNVPIDEFNASDDRGIDTVRGKIKRLSLSSSFGAPFRIILLDEVDNMTYDAMEALRRIMERSESARFILTCNQLHKVTEPIQSRCALFEFKRLSDTDVIKILAKIVRDEGMQYEDLNSLKSALIYLARESNGDLRRAITNGIERLIDEDKKLNLVDLRIAVDKPDEIMMILRKAIDESDLTSARNQLYAYYNENRANPNIILRQFAESISTLENEPLQKIKMIEKLGEVERGIKMGCDPLIQLLSFLATVWLVSHVQAICQNAVV